MVELRLRLKVEVLKAGDNEGKDCSEDRPADRRALFALYVVLDPYYEGAYEGEKGDDVEHLDEASRLLSVI